MRNLFTLALLIFSTINIKSQNKSLEPFTQVIMEIKNGDRIENVVGYLISFNMAKLNLLYSGIVVKKDLLENTKETTLHIPTQNGVRKLEVKDLQRYLFVSKSNELAVLRLVELINYTKDKSIFDDLVWISHEDIEQLSFPLDKIAIDKLKESWQDSLVN